LRHHDAHCGVGIRAMPSSDCGASRVPLQCVTCGRNPAAFSAAATTAAARDDGAHVIVGVGKHALQARGLKLMRDADAHLAMRIGAKALQVTIDRRCTALQRTVSSGSESRAGR